MAEVPKKSDGWAVIAAYIIEKEKSGSWRADAPEIETADRRRKVRYSFTQWGKDRAAEIGISTFVFWQYRRAGLLYNHLATTTDFTSGVPLTEVSNQLNPEHLNELEKILRVAPKDLFLELCERVFIKKDIGRMALRAVWDSLKPALFGETKRGRGKSTDVGNKSDFHPEPDDVAKGMVFLEIKKNAANILGLETPLVVTDVRDINLDLPSDQPDVVVCVSGGFMKPPQLHTINFCEARYAADFVRGCTRNTSPGEYTWLLVLHSSKGQQTAADTTDMLMRLEPKSIGIVEAFIDQASKSVNNLLLTRKAKLRDKIDYRLNCDMLKRICLECLP